MCAIYVCRLQFLLVCFFLLFWYLFFGDVEAQSKQWHSINVLLSPPTIFCYSIRILSSDFDELNDDISFFWHWFLIVAKIICCIIKASKFGMKHHTLWVSLALCVCGTNVPIFVGLFVNYVFVCKIIINFAFSILMTDVRFCVLQMPRNPDLYTLFRTHTHTRSQYMSRVNSIKSIWIDFSSLQNFRIGCDNFHGYQKLINRDTVNRFWYIYIVAAAAAVFVVVVVVVDGAHSSGGSIVCHKFSNGMYTPKKKLPRY